MLRKLHRRKRKIRISRSFNPNSTPKLTYVWFKLEMRWIYLGTDIWRVSASRSGCEWLWISIWKLWISMNICLRLSANSISDSKRTIFSQIARQNAWFQVLFSMMSICFRSRLVFEFFMPLDRIFFKLLLKIWRKYSGFKTLDHTIDWDLFSLLLLIYYIPHSLKNIDFRYTRKNICRRIE